MEKNFYCLVMMDKKSIWKNLLIQINQKFNDLKNNLGNLGENKLLLITAVKVMDEYYETKKKLKKKKRN